MSTVEKPDATVQPNGGRPESADQIPVENPATGQIIGYVEDMSAAKVEALVARARLSQPGWEAMGFEGRGDVMYELRHWIVQNRDRLIGVVVAENGKTREDALLAELFYICDSLGFWAKRARKYLADERIRPHSPLLLGKKVIVRHRPYGVLGGIGPWDYPLTLGFGGARPA